jgi:hypothetical protein
MVALFDKIESLKSQVEFQLRVSFIEVEEFVSSELNEKKKHLCFCGVPHDMNLTCMFVSVDFKRRGQGSA